MASVANGGPLPRRGPHRIHTPSRSLPPGGSPRPRRILLATKYYYLGDALVLTPALRAVRRAWPEARISLLTGPMVRTLLQGCPDVDEYLLFEPRWRYLDPWTNAAMVRALRPRRFTRAILFNRALQPAFVAAAAGIPQRVGHQDDYRGIFLTNRISLDPGRRELDCNLDLVRAAGARLESWPRSTELWVTAEEDRQARALLAEHGANRRGRLVAIQPATGNRPGREWPAEHFARLAERLSAEAGVQIVLLGSRSERAISERVAAAMREKPVILTGRTSLRQVIAVVALCRMLIANDSGLLHVAAALGKGTVGIYNPPNAARWGYDGPRHRMIVYPSTPRSSRAHVRALLDAVPPEKVFDAAAEVLSLCAGSASVDAGYLTWTGRQLRNGELHATRPA